MSEPNFEGDEIALRKKLPKEVKEKIIKTIFLNVIGFILMIIITFAINISFSKLEITIFERCIRVVQLILALVTIVLFEISYRKDNMKLCAYAIEWALFSIAVLFVPFMYVLNYNTTWMSGVLFSYLIYYFSKAIIILLLNRHEYLKNNMSDIKEIVKEEKKGYIDEESNKTLKIRKEEEKKAKEQNNSKDNKNSKAQNNSKDNKKAKGNNKKSSKKKNNKK